MKKVIFMFLSLSIFMTSINAQKTALKDNPLFVENFNKVNELANLIYNNYGKNTKRIAEVKKAVSDINASAILTDEEKVAEMNRVLNLSGSNTIQTYANNFKQNWDKLKIEYGQRLTNEYIQQQTDSLTQKEVVENIVPLNPCARQGMYLLCCSAATTVAILCHAACVETLFGMFACFGLCATGQTYAMAVCYDTYCGTATQQ